MRIIENTLSTLSFLLLVFLLLGCQYEDPMETNTSVPPDRIINYEIGDPDTEGNISAKVTSNNIVRDFEIHLPNNLSDLQGSPVVFNFHGLTSTAAFHKAYTQMDLTSDKNGFIVVYPQGLKAQTFFAGFVTQWDTQYGTNTKDVLFVSDMISALYEKYEINLKRVYATGFSNGGFMSFRLACELSYQIAAVAPIAANIPRNQQNACSQEYSVPIMMIHGTKDPQVPVNGNSFFESTLGSIEFFTKKYECDSFPIVTDLENMSTTDNSTVELLEYQNCRAESNLKYYRIMEGGHTWPGVPTLLSGPSFGSTNQDIDANQLIWDFFENIEHPLFSN